MMASGVGTLSWNPKSAFHIGWVAQYLSLIVSRLAKATLFGMLLVGLSLVIALLCAGAMMMLFMMAVRERLKTIRA